MRWHCLYYVMLLTYMSMRWLFRVKHAAIPRFLYVWTSCWKYIMIYIYVIVPIPIIVITYADCRSLAMSSHPYCWCFFNVYRNHLQLEEVGICWIHCVHMNKWQIWNSPVNNQMMKNIRICILLYRTQNITHTKMHPCCKQHKRM